MRKIAFRKMHGLGNDFVIIDARNQTVDLTTAQIIQICDRHFGVGCDQLVTLHESDIADIRVVFYNGDGSQSGACGNATRCIAQILFDESKGPEVTIQTDAGILKATQTDSGQIAVDMGEPLLDWQQIPLAQECDTLHLPLSGDPIAVNMGNPHCVHILEDNSVDNLVETQGKAVENDPLFPERTNVEFVYVLGDNKLRQRTWERGAGITLACGSGACAVAVAAARREIVDRAQPIEVVLDGGSLWIEWRQSDNHVIMTGPASYVFDGQLESL